MMQYRVFTQTTVCSISVRPDFQHTEPAMEKSFFPYIAAFVWIGLLLIIGIVLRARIKWLQTFLFPASLIGGLIGFALMRFDIIGIPTSTGWQTIPESTFSMMTFHLFAFSFVGVGFLKNNADDNSSKSGTAFRGALWMGWLFGLLFSDCCYCRQHVLPQACA